MKPILKHLHSPDVDFRDYQPDAGDNFSFLLQAMIGPEGNDASESFDILVCTPRWLVENCHEPQWGRHMLIVPGYDLAKIREIIEKHCRSCEGKDWDAIAALLSRIGRWEFEDYRQ